jgi:hypothetical protein
LAKAAEYGVAELKAACTEELARRRTVELRTPGDKWRMPPWMQKYRALFVGTGGNPVEALMNDRGCDPASNLPRFTCVTAVEAQVGLLEVMWRRGLLSQGVLRLETSAEKG